MFWKYEIIKSQTIFIQLITLVLMYELNFVKSYYDYMGMGNSEFYILVYTNPERSPFSYAAVEDTPYVKKMNCRYQNCFFKKSKDFFPKITQFDVILFNVADLSHLELPEERKEEQKYIFVSDEPPTVYSAPDNYDEFFNFTWTYKLGSDSTLRFLMVKNKITNEIVGPVKDLERLDGTVHWIDFSKVEESEIYDVKTKIQNKNKAVAWFASECHTSSRREEYVKKLSDELKKLSLTLDVYGKCGNLTSPNDNLKSCYPLLEQSYYFYLAFESAKCEDYVTEELLIPLKNYAVPIVYGGGNYERFMAKEMYIDANNMEPADLATTINNYITNPNKYFEFFKWHKYYSYHYPNETADTDEVCDFCAFLNDNKHFYKTTVYTSIEKFWTCN